MKKILPTCLITLLLCLSGCRPAGMPVSPTATTTRAPGVLTIEPFQDVRDKDLTYARDQDGQPQNLDKDLIATLWFNQSTIWPEQVQPIAEDILERGKNPGLGVRALHEQGITGKGVNVAIIDQNLQTDHPEYSGKIVEYTDVGTGQSATSSSMHGPAVASLLAGETIGTAPGAKVYYAAAPSWKLDAQYYADALNWIIDENAKLPADQKIRVVSVSAAPSGPGTNFTHNNAAWDSAVQRAAAAEILVLDCTSNSGITAPCYYDRADVENVEKCQPGWPTGEYFASKQRIYIPSSFRTTAEEYTRGHFAYQYDGQGGLSWTVPYLAGVLAMGWQLRPDLSSDEMLDLLFASAYQTQDQLKIINPAAFIESVKLAGNP
jgi:serine protease AprX